MSTDTKMDVSIWEKLGDGVSAFSEAFGKFLTRLKEDGDSIVLSGISFDEREMLMETQDDVFYITAHYRNYPSVLMRLSAAEPASEPFSEPAPAPEAETDAIDTPTEPVLSAPHVETAPPVALAVPPPAPFSAPHTPFNVSIEARRRFAPAAM